jgi:RimJ/RimL family protein N-acetyltransferase
VQLTVFSPSRRAIALYEKQGFRREGTLREFLQRDGMRHDVLLYGLLRPEHIVRSGVQDDVVCRLRAFVA